ncbi:MAG: hypothetical protein ABSD20_19295 [Terriglobales bacterium]|jgi:uncharacterized membrane protein
MTILLGGGQALLLISVNAATGTNWRVTWVSAFNLMYTMALVFLGLWAFVLVAFFVSSLRDDVMEQEGSQRGEECNSGSGFRPA